MLKMETKNKVTTVSEGGEIKFIGTLKEALDYVFYKRFFALVRGEDITSHSRTVDSLMPPLRKRTVNILILDEEAV